MVLMKDSVLKITVALLAAVLVFIAFAPTVQ